MLTHISSSDDSTSPLSTTIELLTPPELSPDYYDSPPSPPQSLEDQIHEAYALDNIRLAKILYLKLQGIHLVDDSDPRIEQVREEDFPFGRLILDEEDERVLKESQKKERRGQQRANKLAQCERTWDQSTVEYRQQRLSVQQRRQTTVLTERRGHDAGDQEKHRSQLRRPSSPSALSLLSSKSLYDASPHSTPSGPYSFEYPVPTGYSLPVDIPSRSPRSSELRREPPQALGLSQSISFRQVSACMSGALFPVDDVSMGDCKRQSHAHAALLEVLLQPVTWERGERSDARITRRNSLPSFGTWSSNATLCSACSSTSGSPSTSTLASSQSGSPLIGVRRLTISTSNPAACESSVRTRKTYCSTHSLTQTDIQECPLFFQKSTHTRPDSPPSDLQPKPRSRFASRLVRKIGHSVSAFIDVAAQFHASYMRTAAFMVPFEDDLLDDETAFPPWGSKTPTVAKANNGSKAKVYLPFDPTYPRAKISEATGFIRASAWSGADEEVDLGEEEHYTLVQLLSPSERRNPSPYSNSLLSMHITPSPLRPRDAPAMLRYRIRPVANPVLLRLKALQNVCAGEGVEWEGRAREGALGFGCDRLHGIAFDGIGRSRLGLEVSF